MSQYAIETRHDHSGNDYSPVNETVPFFIHVHIVNSPLLIYI